MGGGERDLATAFTYAWWLTGDDAGAEAAVRAVAHDDGDRELGPLLVRVRATAVRGPTMCPASEVALLHDGHGLALDEAARIARVPAADARTELAHGRLEALAETVREAFEHPERLGGLAVGNPADVAHARQCESCAWVRGLLDRGRSELTEVVAVPLPPSLRALLERSDDGRPATGPLAARPDAKPPALKAAGESLVREPATEPPAARPAAAPPAREPAAAPSARQPAAAPPAREPAAEPSAAHPAPQPPAREPAAAPSARQPAAAPPGREPLAPVRRRPGVAVWVGAAALLTGIALLAVALGEPGASTARTAPQPTGASGLAAEPTPDSRATTAATARTEPATTATPSPPAPSSTARPPAGFAVTRAGLLLDGSPSPLPDGAVVPADEPLLVAVDYRGATDGVVLEGVWTVDGRRLRNLRVLLTGRRSRHVFGTTVPAGGWPAGRHRIVLRALGDTVGTVAFTVRTP